MDVPSMPEHPHEIDLSLWVELVDSDVRWYICGNPHTFPGHFDVWSPDLDRNLTVSKSDVAQSSEPARWWIEGFLHGNEPSITEYLGLPDDADVADDDPAWEDWKQALDQYRRSGETIQPRVTFTDAD
jgi:hypothetical protein